MPQNGPVLARFTTAELEDEIIRRGDTDHEQREVIAQALEIATWVIRDGRHICDVPGGLGSERLPKMAKIAKSKYKRIQLSYWFLFIALLCWTLTQLLRAVSK